jgi:hypothetical protein
VAFSFAPKAFTTKDTKAAGIGETSPQIAQMGADQERPGGFAQKTQTSPQMTLITLIYTDQSSIEPF